MPQFAWKAMVQELMAEAGIPSQEKLAEEIHICSQTVSRWFGEKPSVPSTESFEKVLAFAKISEAELRRRWAGHMQDLYGEPGSARAEEVREPAPEYEELGMVAQARQLANLDLGEVLPEQAPSLQEMRGRMETLADAVEALQAALRSVLTSYVAVYGGASDGARRAKRAPGG